MTHLIKARCDQSGKPDNVDLLFFGRFKDLRGWHHDTQVNHLVIVTLQNNTHDVLANVMHIALHRRHQDGAIGGIFGNPKFLFFLLHVRHEIGHRLLHHTRRLHHLGQEHFAGTEKVADNVHAVHQRPFNHMKRTLRFLTGFFRIFLNEGSDPIHKGMAEPVFDRHFTPGKVFNLFLAALSLELFGNIKQPLGCIITAIQDDIFNRISEFCGNVFINRQLTGIHNPHIHTRLDGVIKEHRMHGLAHSIVATE